MCRGVPPAFQGGGLYSHLTFGVAVVLVVARLLAYAINDRDRWRRFLVFVFLVLAVTAIWWLLADGGVHVLLRDFGRT
jgi:hypothetical protein